MGSIIVSIVGFVVALAVTALLFYIFRAVVLWYWKVDEVVDILSQIVNLLKGIEDQLSSDKTKENIAEKKCHYCHKIIKSVDIACRYCGRAQPGENTKKIMDIDPKSTPSNIYTVKIEGPDDTKKIYLIAKEFYKDADVSLGEAKELLSTGTIMNFEDENKALHFIEKYQMTGCKVYMVE